MTPPATTAAPLPLHYLFVAGLGRRRLGPEADVRSALRATLKSVEETARAAQARPVAIASGAIGADQLFLETAHELGWPLRLVLPAPAHVFEQDFVVIEDDGPSRVDQAGLDRFRRLLAAAIEVEIVPPSADRHLGYTRCANTLVAEADVLVALWDAEPGKPGGTNESLLLARQLGVPALVLDTRSVTPAPVHPASDAETLLRRHRERHADGAILHDLDVALGHSLPGEKFAEFAAQAPAEQHERFGRLLSRAAETSARSYKRKNLRALACHAVASAVGLSAILFVKIDPNVPHSGEPWATGANVFKLLAVFAAFWLAHSAKKQGAQNRWVKARFVREINRSLASSAEVARLTGEPHDAFAPSSVWVHFRHLRRPLHLFHSLSARPSATDLPAAIRAYRQHRLQTDPNAAKNPDGELSQHDYQVRTGRHAGHLHHLIERGYQISLLLFAVCGLALFTEWLHHHEALYKLAKLMTVFLPILAAALLVLPNLWDIHRRRRVAPALARTLARLDAELAEVEFVLTEAASGRMPSLPNGVAVWTGAPAAQKAAVESWARARFATIAREAEHAILTEVIGFKTFVENAEVG